jgi:hypothetical protein
MITDDEIGSGTSNDRSRTEDELDDYDHNNDSSTNINTHEFNQLMPPYSIYPLL